MESPDYYDDFDPGLSDSVYSVNTPGPSRYMLSQPRSAIPLHFDEDLTEVSGIVNDTVNTTLNESLLKITAAAPKEKKDRVYVLAKPKLIKPDEPEVGQPVRRSQRTRVRPLQRWLNENPLYDVDENGRKF